jgi:hypothetical protein
VDLLFVSGQYLRPDLLFVPGPPLAGITNRGVEQPPGLVVEVLSPTSGSIDRVKKPRRYGDFGVPEYWVVDPEERVVWVWRFAAGGVDPERVTERVLWHPAGAAEPAAALHELGNALHYTLCTEQRFELTKLGSTAVNEAFGALFRGLVEEPQWLSENAPELKEQERALREIYEISALVRANADPEVTEIWRRLQTSDHFYYMCTKFFADGDVHAYFSPYQNPYEAFVNYMSVLDHFRSSLSTGIQAKERHLA